MLCTELLHCFSPVGVIIIIMIFREIRVVVDFRDVVLATLCTVSTVELRVEERLFQEHGVVVTIKQFVSFRLPVASKTVRILNLSFTSGTTFGFDFDYTVSTL